MNKFPGWFYFRRRCPLMAAAGMIVLIFFLPAGAQNQIQGTRKQAAHEPPPYWAYVVNPPTKASNTNAKPADAALQHVPGSAAAFTTAQTQDFFNVPDWHSSDHPPMPDIVSHGRTPDVFACGYCHLPNGQGRPENASLAGLPVGYIVQQLADFASGLRESSEPKHGPTKAMIANETKANDKETQTGAQYFSQLKPKPWIRVVETDTVPRTHVAGWMLVPSNPRKKEPIGHRIIETPENLQRTELRDDYSGFIAYVPVGSIKKGQALATTGGAGRTRPCANCHGRDLRGVDNVPALAGRSPSYIVRQLYDIQNGARAGRATQDMKPTVENLTLDDMVSIAAYTASLKP